MSLKTIVKDRKSKFPGRVRLTPVSGQTNVYDMVRADQPTEEGTALNAALFAKKADALTEDVTIYVSPSGSDTTGNGTRAKPYKTVQYALETIPKNLNSFDAAIYLEPGTYAGAINVEYFCGGRIIFTGETTNVVTFSGQITVRDAYLQFEYFEAVMDKSYIYVTQGGRFYTGDSAVLKCNGGAYGVYVMYNSKASLAGNTVVNNALTSAIRAGASSEIYVHNISGSGNKAGFQAAGGAVRFNINNITATTMYLTSAGGRIYNAAQSNAPSY